MTDYYVLSPLGTHDRGDVLSFSPEQIGAGVDITHLTSIGAIRVATPLLTPPLAPTLATAGSGGTVAAGVYTVKVSYVTADGETTPSPSATITTSGATSTLTVNSPAPSTGATGWYAYVSQVGGSTLTRQQGSPTAIATNLVLTAPPTSSGAAPRGTNTSGEAARSIPARIDAAHAPQGVGVFTNNGVPGGTTYASIAAYGSICWDVSASPPECYVQTGTIATPNWVQSGGALPAGLAADGLTPGGLVVAGAFTAGDPNAANVPSEVHLWGQSFAYDSPGNHVDGDDVFTVKQRSPLLANSDSFALTVKRQSTLNGFDFTGPTACISDTTTSAQPVVQVLKQGTAVLELTTQKSITGALASVTDAAAKAVLTSIIATLTGIKVAANNTT